MHSPLHATTIIGCLISVGCAHAPRVPADGAEIEQAYVFELTNTIQTTLLELDGSEYATLGDPVDLTWTGQVRQAPVRRFRDGSQGDRVRFLDVTMRQGDAPPQPSELSGLSAELRGFQNREVLAIDLLDEISGKDRWADLMLSLWPALSPRIPDLEPGQSGRERSNLPYMLESGMGMPVVLDLDWTLSGPVPCGSASCWQLDYHGPVRGRGLDRAERWHARYRVSGQAQGTLLLAVTDNAIIDSRLELELELLTTFSDPATQAPRGMVRQVQHQRAQVLDRPEAP